ncbi:MAG: hypothetical protein M1358_10525 [Chloroflexi bacterium]|nr:hypothetical protein [Chloroflexota bacterium]
MTEKKIIAPEAIPDVGSREVSIAGKPYLVVNDAMFTFYQRSMGELSPFFMALRDEKKLLGCRCTRCGIVRVPPFVTRCPDCDFASTELVEVGDVGTMLSTPPITYFANSLFQQQVPFGRGRLVPEGADTALSVNFYTTKGILVPGLVRKGTEMKVVFRDERIGEITDIFCIPTSELAPEQVRKKGLTESELNWERAEEPGLPEATEADIARYKSLRAELSSIVAEMNACERARKDIADWQRAIAIKTTGGRLTLTIRDGTLALTEGISSSPDFTMVCRDLGVLVDGLGYRGSLTQAIITRDLWISKNVEFTTVFKLERMSRSLARSKKS